MFPQSVHWEHAGALFVLLKNPVEQGVHTLLLVELPITARKDPGPHMPNVVHIGAFGVSLNVPLGHTVQAGIVLVPPMT